MQGEIEMNIRKPRNLEKLQFDFWVEGTFGDDIWWSGVGMGAELPDGGGGGGAGGPDSRGWWGQEGQWQGTRWGRAVRVSRVRWQEREGMAGNRRARRQLLGVLRQEEGSGVGGPYDRGW